MLLASPHRAATAASAMSDRRTALDGWGTSVLMPFEVVELNHPTKPANPSRVDVQAGSTYADVDLRELEEDVQMCL
jgi:hypothetical protein